MVQTLLYQLLVKVMPIPAPDCGGIGTREFAPLALWYHDSAVESREPLLSCILDSRRY